MPSSNRRLAQAMTYLTRLLPVLNHIPLIAKSTNTTAIEFLLYEVLGKSVTVRRDGVDPLYCLNIHVLFHTMYFQLKIHLRRLWEVVTSSPF